MSQKDQFVTLFNYAWHTTAKLMDCAERLTDGQYRAAPGYGRGSIHDLIFHIIQTQRSWRLGMAAGKQVPSQMAIEDYPSLGSLRAALEAERQAWTTLLQSLSEDEIGAEMNLEDRRGNVHAINRWRILQHLSLHSMQHFAEVAQMLTVQGVSPGDIDFIFYA